MLNVRCQIGMDFKEIILNFGNQIKEGYEGCKDIKIDKEINQIIFCGMGGSALAGDLIKILRPFLELKLAVKIHKSYCLPDRISDKALAIIASYSGNTKETLSSYEEAKNKGLTIISMGSGGQLKELSEKDKIKFIGINEKKIPPRLAVGYFLGIILKLLVNSNLVKNIENEIETLSLIKSAEFKDNGKILADFLKEKIIIIYSSKKYFPLAYQWKISFNENSKILAFTNYFPELMHNEIAGYQFTKKNELGIIILKDENESENILNTISMLEKILEKQKIIFKTINLEGNNELVKIISSIIAANWTTYYLAKFYNIEPSESEIIEEYLNV